MEKVLVTGAGGFIGSHLLNYVKEQGFMGIGWGRNVGYGLRNIDFEKIEEIILALKEDRPDIIIHCAGCADVGKSFENPQVDFRSNVLCTYNLLYAISESGLRPKMLFLSSAAVYGNPSSLPVNETASRNPMSPYAIHKMMAEDACLFFSRHYNIPIKIARIFSAYGGGLKKQVFWDMNVKLNSTGKLELFGSGDETRDFIHISDVVRALMLIITRDTDEIIFNVANGEETTIRKAAEIFVQEKGLDSALINFNGINRQGDPLFWRADISRIVKLGYKSETGLTEGIHDYAVWLDKNDND